MVLDKPGSAQDKEQTPPGPENLQAGFEQPSAVEQVTSKIEAEKQYSGADVKKMVEDALSANGREQKDRAEKAEANVTRLTGEVTTLTTQYTTVSGQVTELLKVANEAEADKVKDDPVALSSLRVRQANAAETLRLQGVDAEATRKLAESEAKGKEADKKLVSVNIKLAAMSAGVDEKQLADLVPDGDSERLKKTANILKQSSITQQFEIDPATGKPVIDPTTGKPKPAALSQKPASPIGAGVDSRSVSEAMLEKAKKK